ncbi:MAG: acetylglutamate kinase [Chloroflexi bacterium RBG_13_54_9]|nr:MAG: acetylglutamate kinase [Chloroflexi bacterium RBG_13_54_9]
MQGKSPSARTIVVKIGGSTLGSHDTTLEDIVELQKKGTLPVVVHGGGKTISEWLEKQGVATRFVRGLRVTDDESLKVVIAVLAGLVNKELVAAINARGGRAIGMSGIDGRFIEAAVKNPELGLVGEVVRINPEPLKAIMEAGFVPVIAPLGANADAEGASVALNINADTVAGEIAAALGAERLILLTDVAGVLDESGEIISRLSATEAEALLKSGVASGGMVPKIEACLRALYAASTTQIVDGRVAHALIHALEDKDSGTRIEKRGEGT